jgi:hypothetical protein
MSIRIGDIFDRLKVIGICPETRSGRQTYCVVKCVCGQKKETDKGEGSNPSSSVQSAFW